MGNDKAALICLALVIAGFIFNNYSLPNLEFKFQRGNVISSENFVTPVKAVFVGDLMLGRSVETMIKSYGEYYPYLRIQSFLEPYDYVFANFEGALPKQHRQTPDLTFSFSIDSARLLPLHDIGITHVSLANNHSHDYGEEGYLNAQEQLKVFGIEPVIEAATSSLVTRFALNVRDISVIAIDYTESEFDYEHYVDLLKVETQISDDLIAYIHWGNEYQTTHSQRQQELAHFLIDNGVDLIIGHHPHIVQDVGLYRDVLIFYSLGNFVFDQYFSKEVQQGLALEVSYDSKLETRLFPFTSQDKRASPRLMTLEESEQFFTSIATNSEKNVSDYLQDQKQNYSDWLAFLP